MAETQMKTSKDKQASGGKESIVRGSLWMTLSNIFSRLLGAVYIIPWYAWMQPHAELANSLFGKGYNIYSLFLMIATAGIPSAVAKQISKYNSLNEYGLSDKLFKRSLYLMGSLGIIFASVMYFAAPVLAQGDGNLVPTMRSLSLAVLIFPCMSIIRGFFQGNKQMLPFAISQIVEQIIRVFYMLLMTFIIMKVFQGSYVEAVTQSTFAAFVGMIGSLAVLIYFYFKSSKTRKELVENSANQMSLSTFTLLKEMLIESIPFILVGIAIPLFKLVDQYTFEPIMHSFTKYSSDELKSMFSILSVNPDKLTMIIISLATSISAASLPVITEYYTLGNKKELGKLTSESFQLFMLVMFPSIVGMSVLSQSVYTLFYGYSHLGALVLVACAISSLTSGFFMLSSVILQGMFRNKELLIEYSIGIVIKILLQYPCIRLFEIYGPIISTTIAFIVTDTLIFISIYKTTKFNIRIFKNRVIQIATATIIMGVVVSLVRWLCLFILTPESRLGALVIFILCAGSGIAIYGYLLLKWRVAESLLGVKITKLREKIGIK